MSVGLQVTYLYHDVDVVEVRVTVDNACFRSRAPSSGKRPSNA